MLATHPSFTLKGIKLNPYNMPAIRMVGKKKIQGYVALWGNRNKVDCVGTWFDRDNPPDLGLGYDRRDYNLFVPFRLKYEHGADPDVKGSIIGMVTRVWEDDYGIAFEGELNTSSPHYNRVAQEIADGKLATSSGSAEHLASFTKDNAFDEWNLAELSLTAFPCEAEMPMVSIRRRGQGRAVRDWTAATALLQADDYVAYDSSTLEGEDGNVPFGTSGVVIAERNDLWVAEYQDGLGQRRYFGFTNDEVAEGWVTLQRSNLKRAVYNGIQQALRRYEKIDWYHLPEPYDVVQDQMGNRWLMVAQQSFGNYVGVPYIAENIDLFAKDYGIVGNLLTGIY